MSKSATKNHTSTYSVYQLSTKKAMFSGQRVCGLYVKYPYFTSKVYFENERSTEDSSLVGCSAKGVVRLTYEWCHVIIPLLYCNELYSWTVTPRVSLCPVLLSAHWAWPRASALQVVWRAGTYMACTLGGTHEGPIKLDRAFDLKGNFWEMQKMTPKNQITLEIFRMLKCNDFLMYSSYTTKMYMKNMGGSARNSVVEK